MLKKAKGRISIICFIFCVAKINLIPFFSFDTFCKRFNFILRLEWQWWKVEWGFRGRFGSICRLKLDEGFEDE